MSDHVYFPSYCFHGRFTFNERAEIARTYSDPKWREGRRNVDSGTRKRISRSAIRIAEVMKEKLQIELFPLVIPVAQKSFSIAEGTAAFRMIDDKGNDVYFADRAQYFKSMKSNYSSRIHYGDLWIYR